MHQHAVGNGESRVGGIEVDSVETCIALEHAVAQSGEVLAQSNILQIAAAESEVANLLQRFGEVDFLDLGAV